MRSHAPDNSPHWEPDPPGATVVRIGPHRPEIDACWERIAAEANAAGYHETSRFAVRLAFEEAVSNAIGHGNRNRPTARVEVCWHVSPQRIFLRITDEGEGFDPASVIDPTLDENLETQTGRGLLLMRAYMTTVAFNERGNSVVMIHHT